MRRIRNRASVLAGAALLVALALGPVVADDAAPAVPAAPVKPIAALIIDKPDKGVLLGLARVGAKAVAVGGNGLIIISTDGKSWRQVPSPVDTALVAVAFADDQHGWAVGHDAVILGTRDGGVTWTIQNFQPDLYSPMFAVLPISSQTAIAVGAFGMIKATADGGQHWSDVNAPAVSGDKLHLNAVARLANGRLAIAGEHGLVGVSSDGVNWVKSATPYEGSFFGILPWGANGAITFGMRGNVYVSADVDKSDWRKLETGTTSSLFGGELTADGRALLSGADGCVLAVSPDGTVTRIKNVGAGVNDGSFTGSATFGQQTILVGESGVKSLPKL